jgi:DNA-binding CsgD family transcriptional regulator
MTAQAASQAAARVSRPAVSAGAPILAAKITAPGVPDWVVSRPRITKLIDQRRRWCPLTVITAPAGAGKTMALALWAAAEPGPVAWVGLDEFDGSAASAPLPAGRAADRDPGQRPGVHQRRSRPAPGPARRRADRRLDRVADPADRGLGGGPAPGRDLDAHPSQGRRSLATALRLAEREQLRLPFALERSWIGPALRRDPDLACAHRGLLAPALGRDQLPGPQGAPERAAILVIEPLTARERDVLRHVARMLSTAEIASEMYISTNTVKTHLKNIYRKLAATSRSQAVRRARQLELI